MKIIYLSLENSNGILELSAYKSIDRNTLTQPFGNFTQRKQRKHQQRSDRNVKEWPRKRLVGRYISRRLLLELSTRWSCRSMICWVKDYKGVFEWRRGLSGGGIGAVLYDNSNPSLLVAHSVELRRLTLISFTLPNTASSLCFYGKERFKQPSQVQSDVS